MKILILLSAGRHPSSGAPRPVPVELQAIMLALSLPDATATGLHAGPDDAAIADAFGHGLNAITILDIDEHDDPLPALRAEIALQKPDLILAGRRGMGGADSGLLPYRLAHACNIPIIADAMAIEPDGNNITVIQALKRGARRRIVVSTPALVTIHDAAPPPRPFIHSARLAGQINHKPGTPTPSAVATPELEIRPYRARPKLIGNGPSGASAEDRLRAATEATSQGGRLMLNPTPDDAAEAILDYVGRFRPANREQK